MQERPARAEPSSTVLPALLLLCASCAAEGTPAPLAAFAAISGDPLINAGSGVAGAGDVDGDGADDLLVRGKVVVDDGSNEAVALFSGPRSGTVAGVEATALILGPQFLHIGGTSDLNGDGFSDLVVDTGYQVEDGYGSYMNAVHVFYGPLEGERHIDTADARVGLRDSFREEMADSYWPFPLASPAGDIDGDGNDDLLLSALTMEGSERALLFSGPFHSTLSEEAATATISGASLAGRIGDLDGDGHDDVLVASRLDGVGIFYGPLSGTHSLDDAQIRISGWDLVYAVRAVTGAGDVDGDGRIDLAVTLRRTRNFVFWKDVRQEVLIFTAVDADRSLRSPDARLIDLEDYVALDIAPVGDMNGDGYSDLAVGRRGYVVAATRSRLHFDNAFLFYGPFSGDRLLEEAEAVFDPAGEDTYYRAPVAAAGDMDGDGRPDLVVGAPDAPVGSSLGAAYLIAGSGP